MEILIVYAIGFLGAFIVGIIKDRIGLGILLGLFAGLLGFIIMLFVKSSSAKMKEQATLIAEATNISSSSVTTNNSINDGSQNVSSSEITKRNNSTNEMELELKKIEDMFEKSLITEDEKKEMRNKVLGVS